jgi:hypothetical protein
MFSLPRAFFCLATKETKMRGHKSQTQKLPWFSLQTANLSSLAYRRDSALRSSAAQTFVVFYVCYLMTRFAQGKSYFIFGFYFAALRTVRPLGLGSCEAPKISCDESFSIFDRNVSLCGSFKTFSPRKSFNT